MQTLQFDTLTGNAKAVVSPQVTTPPPAGVTFIHYDESKVDLPLTITLAAAQIATSAVSIDRVNSE